MDNNSTVDVSENEFEQNPEKMNNEQKEGTETEGLKGPQAEANAPITLETELATLKDQWLRAMAETENLRRRAQKDREEALKYASTNFGRDMLTVADNLRRALESISTLGELPDSMKPLVEGIELTENSLLSTFERHGIKKIDPLNEKFDANIHQAMFEVEDGSVSAGTIVQVLQAGYMMHDRLLRPAMVGVSKAQ